MRRKDAPLTSRRPARHLGLGRGEVEHGARDVLGGRHAAERALGADLVAARAGQRVGGHVGLRPARCDRGDGDAVRAQGAGQRLAEGDEAALLAP